MEETPSGEKSTSSPPAPSRAVAKKITDLDRDTLELIKVCGGVVHVNLRGEPGLESNTQITGAKYRLRRLVALGLIESSGDALIEGEPPQTYRLVDPVSP